MPQIEIDESAFHYELSGSGHPLILMGGIGCDPLFWYPILPELSRHFQVLLFERKEESQKKPLSSSIEALAQEVRQLCEKLSLHKPHLLGHSMGGCIAQFLAYRHREQFSSIIISNSFLKLSAVAKCQLTFQLHLLENKVPKELFFESLNPWLFSNAFLEEREKMERIRAARAGKTPSLIRYQMEVEALCHFDSTSWFYRMLPPLLVIHSMEDILAPHDSERLARETPKACLISFPSSGHLPMIEEPEEFANVAIRFLTNHPSFFSEPSLCKSV